MQKIKFQIKGMHCNSCAFLIEEKLKSKPGIIRIKVNYDSQKAVVVYDEGKIQETDIAGLMKEAGNYQVDKIEEKPEETEGQKSTTLLEEKQEAPGAPAKNSFLLGLLTSISIVSLFTNVVLGIKLFKLPQAENSQQLIKETRAQDQVPVQPSPTQPATTIQTFEISKNDHVRGDFNAPVTLVEFSDFECPFCERFYPTLNKILSDYNGKVRLVYKHFPLGFHPNAQKAAEASECAAEQGKFWEYHDKLFENQTSGYSLEKFKQWAKDLALNTKKFNDCLDSGKYAQKIQADYQEGQQKGVNGTPATFVNGQLVSGAVPYESFKQIIDTLWK